MPAALNPFHPKPWENRSAKPGLGKRGSPDWARLTNVSDLVFPLPLPSSCSRPSPALPLQCSLPVPEISEGLSGRGWPNCFFSFPPLSSAVLPSSSPTINPLPTAGPHRGNGSRLSHPEIASVRRSQTDSREKRPLLLCFRQEPQNREVSKPPVWTSRPWIRLSIPSDDLWTAGPRDSIFDARVS